jgi:formylglycine-generating enzyme required for sulfatase activity
MAGNVWEWTANDYDNERNRVVRGGSFDYGGRNLRAAVRSWLRSDVRFYNLGFRCLRE